MADKQKTYPHFSIQMLEPRIMFDGAAVYAASEAIEAVEDQIQNNSLSESDLSTNLKAITPVSYTHLTLPTIYSV